MLKNLITLLVLLFSLISCSETTDSGGGDTLSPVINTSTSSSTVDQVGDPDNSASGTGHYYKVITPTGVVKTLPRFEDDMNFEDLDLAINRQIKAFKRLGLNGEIYFGGKKYPLSILRKSLVRLFDLSEKAKECIANTDRKECMDRFNDSIKANFVIYGPQNNSNEIPGTNVTYTAYYGPLIKASKVKTKKFPYAIHRMPKDDSLRKSTREEIIWEGALAGKGLEIFYIEDLWDLYILHLEGGGAVQVGSKIHYLSYEGHNSNKFNFISKYMKKMGHISNTSFAAQEKFLIEHPEKLREIFSQCPGHIYFKESSTSPVGLENIPLTANRSIAQDKKYYKRKGLISYVETERPVMVNGKIVQKKLARFYIDQDTGPAILGGARADIYFGFGAAAELAGRNMHAKGKMYYLISK
ncbi:MAG: MltA domain-containing protein [Bacteriovoracaceae bacterium]|nr:MltA domain-containing protein [Bacteriovoracaceae bacterium]